MLDLKFVRENLPVVEEALAKRKSTLSLDGFRALDAKRRELSVAVENLRAERNAAGTPAYTPLIAVGLMVFYVFAMMCMSTMAVTVRESGGGALGWKWAGVQFGYMLTIAYVAAWIVYHGGRALGFAG
jgi:Fe2+ transport system protein B